MKRVQSTKTLVFLITVLGCGGYEGESATSLDYLRVSDLGCPSGKTFDSNALKIGASRPGFDKELAKRINRAAFVEGLKHCGMLTGITKLSNPGVFCLPKVFEVDASAVSSVTRAEATGWDFIDSGITPQNARAPRGIKLREDNVICKKQLTISSPPRAFVFTPPGSAPNGCASVDPKFEKKANLRIGKRSKPVDLKSPTVMDDLTKELSRLAGETTSEWTQEVDRLCKAANSGCGGRLSPTPPRFELKVSHTKLSYSNPKPHAAGDLYLLERVKGECIGTPTPVIRRPGTIPKPPGGGN